VAHQSQANQRLWSLLSYEISLYGVRETRGTHFLTSEKRQAVEAAGVDRAIARLGKALARWASFNLEAGFGPWPYKKNPFSIPKFLEFAKLFEFKSNSNAERLLFAK
jgi:hypothetical protein